MKVIESTVNLGYLMIERYKSVPKKEKSVIIMPDGVASLTPYELGKIMIGEHAGKFCLYPSHVGMKVSVPGQELLFIPFHEVICHVEPDDAEDFVPYVQFKISKRGEEWIATK